MVSTSQKIAVTVSASRKKLSSKVTVSIREKNPSSIAGMKDLFKNKFPLKKNLSLLLSNIKKSFLWQESLKKNIKNGLYWPENPFSLSRMKHLLKNRFLQYGKTASSGKKIKENGFCLEEKVFLLKLAPSNFDNGFQHQEIALNKSKLFPPDRK